MRCGGECHLGLVTLPRSFFPPREFMIVHCLLPSLICTLGPASDQGSRPRGDWRLKIVDRQGADGDIHTDELPCHAMPCLRQMVHSQLPCNNDASTVCSESSFHIGIRLLTFDSFFLTWKCNVSTLFWVWDFMVLVGNGINAAQL